MSVTVAENIITGKKKNILFNQNKDRLTFRSQMEKVCRLCVRFDPVLREFQWFLPSVLSYDILPWEVWINKHKMFLWNKSSSKEGYEITRLLGFFWLIKPALVFSSSFPLCVSLLNSNCFYYLQTWVTSLSTCLITGLEYNSDFALNELLQHWGFITCEPNGRSVVFNLALFCWRVLPYRPYHLVFFFHFFH